MSEAPVAVDASALTASYGAMTLVDMAFKPGFGSEGRKINLVCNLFKLTLNNPEIKIHHYDVTIENANPKEGRPPKAPPRKTCRKVFELLSGSFPDLKELFDGVAFDGLKNAFSASEIPFLEAGYKVTFRDSEGAAPPAPLPEGQIARPRAAFFIKFKHVALVELSNVMQFTNPRAKEDPDAKAAASAATVGIQALDVFLKHDMAVGAKITTGGGTRFFFDTRGTPISESGGGHILCGTFQSVRPTLTGLYVNLDTAYSMFYAPGPLQEVVAAILGRSRDLGRPNQFRLSPQDRNIILRKLRGAACVTNHRRTLSRPMLLRGFDDTPREYLFEDDEPAAVGERRGRRQNMEDYFLEKYKITLKYPYLPSVKIGQDLVLPMELIDLIPGTPISITKSTPQQVQQMIKEAGKPPHLRKREIVKKREEASYESSYKLQQAGIQVASSMVQLEGRVLPPPLVSYSQNARPPVRDGGWNMNNQSMFVNPSTIDTWAVVCFDPELGGRFQQVKDAVNMIMSACRSRGMKINNDPQFALGGSDILASLKEAGRMVYERTGSKKPTLFLVIISDRNSYQFIKNCAWESLPVNLPTQCLLAEKIKRISPQYCTNVAMKINTKIGPGVNHIVPFSDLPRVGSKTIIFGADVSHPPAGTFGREPAPSIAAVVASAEGRQFVYGTQLRLQQSRVEIIDDLSDMVAAHLTTFAKSDGLPDTIVFYRDGVSEGQYKQVVNYEVEAIIDGCYRASQDKNYRPKVNFIICTKRTHIRFFDDSSNNKLPAGVVIDRIVCHPFLFEFFLQSQFGLQGTAKPTLYTVLRNDSEFSPDEIQKLTNNLCYTYARATKSVGLVAPAYYAHILSQKARDLLTRIDADDASVSAGGTAWSGSTSEVIDKMKLQIALERGGGIAPQFYM